MRIDVKWKGGTLSTRVRFCPWCGHSFEDLSGSGGAAKGNPQPGTWRRGPEELPEQDQLVLVAAEERWPGGRITHRYEVAQFGVYTDGKRTFGGLLNRSGWREFVKGVYWQPLPEPPCAT